MSSTYIVAVYLVDKAYGGPEEGGWWYDTGEQVKLIRIFKNEEKAYIYTNRMQRLIDKSLNKGRRPISSMASTGRYYAEVHKDTAPKFYPATTPHYE